jgi:hypothetical protein
VVTNSRNDIKFDAIIYGAHPMEYLRPVETQPVLKALIPNYAEGRNRHSSNPAEYSINLSLALLATIVVAAAAWLIRWRRPRRPDAIALTAPPVLVLGTLATVGVLAFAFSLSPVIYGTRTPTWYLTNFIDMWRVFARLAVVVNIAFVAFAAVALAYLGTKISRRWVKAGALALLFGLIAFEYQIQPPPRPTWSYTKDVPQIYYRLHDQTDINVIAEYSLDEQPITYRPTFYMTYQRVHGKKMLNSAVADSPQAPMRGSLRDIEDPQTIPALQALGIEAIIVHGVDKELDLPGLELVDYQPAEASTSSPILNDNQELYPIWIYKITGGNTVPYVIAPDKGFVYPVMSSLVSYDYVGGNNATLKLIDLPGGDNVKSGRACFDISSLDGSVDTVTIAQDGRTLWTGVIDRNWQAVTFESASEKAITITSNDAAKSSFQLDDLGCTP